jgi:PAS domain S-box-containing protein
VARDHDAGLEELHKTQERLQAVIHSAPVGILEVDLEERVIRWNPAAERIFGWSAEEILGMPVPIVPPQKQAEFEAVLATVRSGRRYPNTETFRQRKDGTLVDVEIAAAPVRGSTGEVVSHMVVFTDITNRKRQERELRASRARIVEAGDSERRRLEHNLHDGAQQRLTSLGLRLQLAAERAREAPEHALAGLKAAEAEVLLAIDELRELAQGIQPAALTEGGLAYAIERIAAHSTIPVEVHGPRSTRFEEGVEAAAYYVVSEAITNAQRYAHASSISVRFTTVRDSLDVEISDDGIGGATERRGSGLQGLRDRVEAIGGTFDVDSPAGRGTRIAAAIPIRGRA